MKVIVGLENLTSENANKPTPVAAAIPRVTDRPSDSSCRISQNVTIEENQQERLQNFPTKTMEEGQQFTLVYTFYVSCCWSKRSKKSIILKT